MSPKPGMLSGSYSLRTALTVALLLVILPTLGVTAITLIHAGQSYREMATQALRETAMVLAQSTASELAATERHLAGLTASGGASTLDISSHDPQDPGLDQRLGPELAALIRRVARGESPQISNLLAEGDGADAGPGDRIAIAARSAKANGGPVDESVVVLRIPASELVRAFDRRGPDRSEMLLAITDGNGRLLARSRDGANRIGQRVADWDRLQGIGQPGGSFLAATLEGERMVTAFQQIPDTPGWTVVVGEPVAIFDAGWQQPLRVMILASAATVLFGLGLSLLIARQVLRPIRGLVARAGRIAEGEAPSIAEDRPADAATRGNTTETCAGGRRQADLPRSAITEFETLRRSLDVAEQAMRCRIADSRQAERMTRESLTRLEQAERLARIGSWVFEPQSRTFTLSRTMRELAGLREDDPSPSPAELAELLDAETFRRAIEALQDCLATGQSHAFSGRFHGRDGRNFPIWLRGEAIRDATGAITGVAGLMQDTTEREDARARMEAIADSLPNGVLYRLEYLTADLGRDGGEITRDTMRFSYISGGIEELIGISAEALMAEPALMINAIHPDDLDHYFETSRRSSDTNTNFECDFRLIKPDGRIIWLQIRSAPRATERGRGWDGIFLDVTPAYEAAEALRAAKRAAETAERAKGDFLATMSHEIRTPMNSVIGMSRLALKTELDPRQRNYLEKINDSANVLLGIINDILDFSKIEAGGLELEQAPFRLEQVLETVAAVTALRAEEKGLELAFDMAPGLPRTVMGDSLRLGQVLTNLVGNAIKFTARGDILVSIRPAPGSGPKRDRIRLQFSVRDSGIGMSAGQIAGLFQPFAQADAETARLYGGTGLGLAISRRLVERMGGTIGVESAPGAGSTFTFTAVFGTRLGDAGADQGGAAPCPAHAALASGLKSARALIVDDNATARTALRDMVGGFGLKAGTAASGDEALELLRQCESAGSPYDIVFLDWRMPGMDGLELARHIRADHRLKHMPAVLMVTAHGHQLVLSEAEGMNLQGVLLKPVTQSVIFNTILDTLSLAPPAPEAGRASPAPSGGEADFAHVLAGRRVLVVDDNALNREVARDFLDIVGIRVATAVNGRDAIARLREEPFDAVLMDVHMPQMSGLEAIREIRRQPQWRDLPVIALTAQARVEDEAASRAAGMSGHLTKPIDEQAMYRMLAAFLGGTAPAPGAEEGTAPEEDPAIPAGLLRRFGGSRDRLGRFVTGFLADHADMVAGWQAQVAADDAAGLADFVHRIRGVVGYLDEAALLARTAEVETRARAGDLAGAIEAGADLPAQMESCLARAHTLALALALDTPLAGTAGATALPPEAVEDLVRRALPLIANGDLAARALLQRLAEGLDGACQGLARDAIDRFDDLDTEAVRELLLSLVAPEPDTPETDDKGPRA